MIVNKYENFKKSLLQTITNADLDVGAVYFVFKDVFKEVEALYYSELNKEAIQATIKEREGKENE